MEWNSLWGMNCCRPIIHQSFGAMEYHNVYQVSAYNKRQLNNISITEEYIFVLCLNNFNIAKFGAIIDISILNVFSCKHENQNVFLKFEIGIVYEESHSNFNKRIVTKNTFTKSNR